MIVHVIEGHRFDLADTKITTGSIIGTNIFNNQRVFIPMGAVKYIILEDKKDERKR